MKIALTNLSCAYVYCAYKFKLCEQFLSAEFLDSFKLAVVVPFIEFCTV